MDFCWRDRHINRQERIHFCTYYNRGTSAQCMLAIFTTNFTAKAPEDTVNWGSRELLENFLNHSFE